MDAPMPAQIHHQVQAGGLGVDRFIEGIEKYAQAGDKRPRSPGGKAEHVTFYKLEAGQSGLYASRLYQTLIELARQDEEMDNQMCAYILSALNIWLPMSVVIEDFMRGLNWEVQVLMYPRDQPRDFRLAEAPKWRDTLISLAQVILIFFKNVSEVNYNTYMLRRVQAIRSFISYKDAQDNELALPVDRARVIRRVLGGDPALKKEILEYILTAMHKASALGRMCAYISGILAWNEMTYLVFMFEELVLTTSPVLSSSEVVIEVRNLAMAIVSILKITHPQYYKILVPVADQKLVDRNKFPTLIEVARRLKEGKSVSAQNFQGSSNVNPDTLNRLLALHRGQHKPVSKVVFKAYEFLAGSLPTADGHMGLMRTFVGEA